MSNYPPSKKRKRLIGRPSRYVRKTRGGDLIYKGKLPPHVKVQIKKNKKGVKRHIYISLITGSRLHPSSIRQNRGMQALAERFPKIKHFKNIEGFLGDYSRAATLEEKNFFEANYKDLLDYLKEHAPELVPVPKVDKKQSGYKDLLKKIKEPINERQTSEYLDRTTKRQTRRGPQRIRRKNRVRKRSSRRSRS